MSKQIVNHQKLYTITQVADLLKVSTHTIRNWEREGKVAASYRTPQGHRRYTEKDVEKLRAVQNFENTTVYVNQENEKAKDVKKHEKELNENLWNTKQMQESLRKIKLINIAAATISVVTLLISSTLTLHKSTNIYDNPPGQVLASYQQVAPPETQNLEKLCKEYNSKENGNGEQSLWMQLIMVIQTIVGLFS
jgi:DNA-binding transcriptional MerR regulator